MGVMEETDETVLTEKHHPPRSTFEVYNKTLIFIPVDITDDVVESVARKCLGSPVPGGTDSEALHGWLLKFGEDSKMICTSDEIFVDWIAN